MQYFIQSKKINIYWASIMCHTLSYKWWGTAMKKARAALFSWGSKSNELCQDQSEA